MPPKQKSSPTRLSLTTQQLCEKYFFAVFCECSEGWGNPEGWPRKRTRGRLQLYNVGAPFKRIAFDILGPLPRSSDGNNNIPTVTDYFTKWPESYPISDQEASTVAEVLVQHWIS
ncbi:retrovirus-related Pol polyprotein from transposon 412 [Trichonephila clavipes]|nr:retrovirus-related Pol polyprotein from transposon 412 [Trichonephila clavipes]